MSKLILGNWKMHGDKIKLENYFSYFKQRKIDTDYHRVALLLPYCYLDYASSLLSSLGWMLGAQDVSAFEEAGAYTGEVNAAMLRDCRASFVLVGHSERRSYFQEGEALLKAKIKALLAAQLCPVFCVGESWQDRQESRQQVVLQSQLAFLSELAFKECIVAYEPIWAIGSGKTPSTTEINSSLEFIRECLLSSGCRADKISLLYGGSVHAENAEEILSIPSVDGLLVGGASLKPADFAQIITYCSQH